MDSLAFSVQPVQRIPEQMTGRFPNRRLARMAAACKFKTELSAHVFARVAELADALDLGSSPERGVGSNPSSRISHLTQFRDPGVVICKFFVAPALCARSKG